MSTAVKRIALATLALCFANSLSMAQAPTAASPEPTAPRPAAATLKAPKGAAQSVDARGFIRRWLVLEPVPVTPRLTDSAVEEALKLAALPSAVAAGNQWHALETTNYNLNLYHFAWALSKPTSNVLFWVETTVDSPREMQGVRLAIGSNAASRWWLNGELVIALNDDRQSVIDDGVSRRITLRKGRNVIRAAIINGGGATDFCARFLDENDRPITGLSVSLPSTPDPRG
jgi:hypothetical protein